MKREYQILVGAALVLGFVVLAMNFEFGHTDGAVQDYVEKPHQILITSERDFLIYMIAHNEAAVASAQFLLESGITDPALVELAESIAREQSKKVVLLRGWFEEWYRETYIPSEDYVRMRPLAGLAEEERAMVFLEDMILHHELVLEATRQLLLLTTRPELVVMAGDILSGQATEIVLVQQLLEPGRR